MLKGNETAKELTRNILFTCLRTGLLLISPFMPYLSEELFQRLPRGDNKDAPSICVASYPEYADVSLFKVLSTHKSPLFKIFSNAANVM